MRIGLKIKSSFNRKVEIGSGLVQNMLLTFFAKGITLISNLLSIPLLIKLIGTESYGSWVTLTSILTWVILLDFGLGHGIKNLVAKKSNNSIIDLSIKPAIIGSIQFFIAFCIFFILILLLMTKFIRIFKWDIISTYFIYIPFLLFFPLSIGNSILQGLRKTGYQSIIGIIKPFIWLSSLIILTKLDFKNNIQVIALIFSFSNILLFIFSFIAANNFSKITFSDIFHITNIKESIPIIKIGLQFFILQISSIMIFNIGNFLNYSYLGGVSTATYDVANKLFLFYISLFNLVISVYWPEIANVIAIKDKVKLKRLRKQLYVYCFLFIVGGFVLIAISPYAFKLLTNSEIEIGYKQLFPFFILVVIQAVAYIGAVFLNAAEKIMGQIVLSIISSTLIVPISFFFFKNEYGIISVPLASILVILPTSIIVNIWTNKLVKEL